MRAAAAEQHTDYENLTRMVTSFPAGLVYYLSGYVNAYSLMA